PPNPPYLPYPPSVAAQDRAATDAMARPVNERIRALQAEADRLAAQSRTLLGDLSQLEIQRAIAAEEVKTADAAGAAAPRAPPHNGGRRGGRPQHGTPIERGSPRSARWRRVKRC